MRVCESAPRLHGVLGQAEIFRAAGDTSGRVAAQEELLWGHWSLQGLYRADREQLGGSNGGEERCSSFMWGTTHSREITDNLVIIPRAISSWTLENACGHVGEHV